MKDNYSWPFVETADPLVSYDPCPSPDEAVVVSVLDGVQAVMNHQLVLKLHPDFDDIDWVRNYKWNILLIIVLSDWW